jgi:hypothetical protein
MNTGQITLKVYPTMKYKAVQAMWIFMIALGIALILSGFYFLNITSGQELPQTNINVETISVGTLEERYGLQMHSIKMTSDGNMIDFRVKIVDAQKAKQVLSDPTKMPKLIIPDKGITLFATAVLDQSIEFADGEVFSLFYRNLGEAVKPGMYVIVSFGEFQLERIPVDESDFKTASVSPASPSASRQRIGPY